MGEENKQRPSTFERLKAVARAALLSTTAITAVSAAMPPTPARAREISTFVSIDEQVIGGDPAHSSEAAGRFVRDGTWPWPGSDYRIITAGDITAINDAIAALSKPGAELKWDDKWPDGREGTLIIRDENLRGKPFVGQICLPAQCRTDRVALERLASRWPGLNFVQIQADKNRALAEFMAASKQEQEQEKYEAERRGSAGAAPPEVKPISYPILMLALVPQEEGDAHAQNGEEFDTGGGVFVANDHLTPGVWIKQTLAMLEGRKVDKNDECQAEEGNNGNALYRCWVRAYPAVHKDFVEPSKAKGWLEANLHKFDKVHLSIADAIEKIAELINEHGSRFDYLEAPKTKLGAGKLGVEIGLRPRNDNVDEPANLKFPEITRPQVHALHEARFPERTRVSDKLALLIERDPKPGTPAYEAGLMKDDEIVAVNNRPDEGPQYVQPVMGLSVNQILALLTGEPESKVALTIVRGTETITRVVTRKEKHYPVAEESDAPGNVARVVLQSFDPGFAHDSLEPGAAFANAVQLACGRTSLSSEPDRDCKASAMVLDLGKNHGGLTTEVINVAESLLDTAELYRETIRQGDKMVTHVFYLERDAVVVRDEKGKELDRWSRTFTRQFPLNRRIVIRMTGESASGAEMLAKVLKKNHLFVTIVGKRSYGKGEEQYLVDDNSPLSLPYGYKADVETGSYTVGGESIDWRGVGTDVEVEQPAGGSEDLQMAKSLEIARTPVSVVIPNVAFTGTDEEKIVADRKAAFKKSLSEELDLIHRLR